MSSPAPVEYAAAVERFLGQAALGSASRRVYRISLASWSWPLVGRPAPRGAGRRGAAPPFVPLARLDDPGTGPALAAALRDRAAGTDVRTVNRELSALRSAVAWWQDQRWITRDPTAGLRHLAGPPPPQPVLTGGELTRLAAGIGRLEFLRTWDVLRRTLPAAPAMRMPSLRRRSSMPRRMTMWSSTTITLSFSSSIVIAGVCHDRNFPSAAPRTAGYPIRGIESCQTLLMLPGMIGI